MIRKIINYIKEDVWTKPEGEIRSPFVRWSVRQIKVLQYTFRGFGEHRLNQTSAALTFFTLMSIVPVAAMVFGIMKGFGLDVSFAKLLYSKFPENHEVIDVILDFANNMLARTKGGVIVAFGFVVLVWAVFRVFGGAEQAFNNIWEVRKSRSVARKLSDYLAIVLIAPILLVMSNGIAIYVRDSISGYYSSASVAVNILYALSSVVTMWALFIFIYCVLPNTRVKFRSALPAAIIAGTLFQAFQIIYVYIQTWMTSYNAIYGGFAALPLFLIWLQISWQITLAGAELSFAYQNIRRFEQERESLHMSYDHRQKVLVGAMLVAIRHFISDGKPVTAEAIASELGMPLRIVRDVVFDLERVGLISAVQNNASERVNIYIPARDVHKITVCDVVDGVEMRGGDADFDLEIHNGLRVISDRLDAMRRNNGASADNVLLMDIMK